MPMLKINDLLCYEIISRNNANYASFNTWYQNVVQELAEIIVGFATTNVTLKIVLLVVNIPVFFYLGRLLFGNWQDFLRVLKKGFIINTLGPFMFLFCRKREELKSALISATDIRIIYLIEFLWVCIYVIEYLAIKYFLLSK
jgi:hypothetical protein